MRSAAGPNRMIKAVWSQNLRVQLGSSTICKMKLGWTTWSLDEVPENFKGFVRGRNTQQRRNASAFDPGLTI